MQLLLPGRLVRRREVDRFCREWRKGSLRHLDRAGGWGPQASPLSAIAFRHVLGPDIARQPLDGLRGRPIASSATSLRHIDPRGKGKLANLHGGRGLADLEARRQRTVLSLDRKSTRLN